MKPTTKLIPINSEDDLEQVLTDALSEILTVEMEKSYGSHLWKDIVLIKPPWWLSG